MTVFEIERYATADGPGIRTVVFLKGCNLRCSWCQNPESQEMEPQVMYFPEQCVGCGKCVEACPEDAVIVDSAYGFITDHDRCTRCGRCVDACFYDARRIVGEVKSVDAVMDLILKDRAFYKESGGGVTFSGGEPMLHADEVAETARRCRKEGVSTAIETAGNVPWRQFEKVLPYIDLVYIDLKTDNKRLHESHVGVSNDLIKKNIARLSQSGINMVVRIPVIPGINDNDHEIDSMFNYLKTETSVKVVRLLPFHRLGAAKYAGLGMEYSLAAARSLTAEDCEQFARRGRALGLDVAVGGD